MNICELENEVKFKKRSSFILDRNSEIITTETLRKLLRKLDEFEQSDLYLKNNISLFKLTAYCGSNTKYISHVLNFCKEKDYNNYINDLRIQYIINKLQSERNYRKFKIAVLAKEAGFSSPNKFSFVFKNAKGILPSTYIKNLS